MPLSYWFVRNIGHPLWLTYKGQTALLSWQRQFKQLFSATQDVIAEWHLRKLREMLVHAARTSPYYESLFKEHHIEVASIEQIQEIQQLPFMTKEILNTRMDKILSTSFKRDNLFESSTGGSSGTPLTFYRDHTVTQVRRAQDYFFNAQIGIYPGSKRAWVWGAPVDSFKLDKLKARIANFLTERAIYFYSFDAGTQQIREFLNQLKAHQPAVVYAYPNMLAELAEAAMTLDETPPRFGKVVVTAEPLYDWQRMLYKEVFGAETFERYGYREIGTVAAQIDAAEPMLVCEPSYIVEVIDEQGRPVENAIMGELVVTDLFNKAMPLIRYRTGDMVKLEAASSDGGSHWRRLAEVGGRVVDLVQRLDGSRIAGEALIMALRTSGVRGKVQLVQERADRLRLLHLQNELVPAETVDRFAQKANELLGGRITIKLEAVAALPYDQSGKYRYVTSRCHTKGSAAGEFSGYRNNS